MKPVLDEHQRTVLALETNWRLWRKTAIAGSPMGTVAKYVTDLTIRLSGGCGSVKVRLDADQAATCVRELATALESGRRIRSTTRQVLMLTKLALLDVPASGADVVLAAPFATALQSAIIPLVCGPECARWPGLDRLDTAISGIRLGYPHETDGFCLLFPAEGIAVTGTRTEA